MHAVSIVFDTACFNILTQQSHLARRLTKTWGSFASASVKTQSFTITIVSIFL